MVHLLLVVVLVLS